MKNVASKPQYNIEPLIRARMLRRWSRAKLAAEIGLTEAMVRRIEDGSRTSEKTIFKMSEVLEVPMDQILLPSTPEERAS